MKLILNETEYEVYEMHTLMSFKPYEQQIQCELNYNIDTDQLSNYLENEYDGNFILNDNNYTGFPTVTLNITQSDRNNRIIINFSTRVAKK